MGLESRFAISRTPNDLLALTSEAVDPALGNGCFGPGCLFSYGSDLVGDDYNGLNLPAPDPDPYDNCEGHGTHVAGIIVIDPHPTVDSTLN